MAVLASGMLSGCQVGRGVFVPGLQEDYKFEQLTKHRPKTRIGTLASSAIPAIVWDSSKLGEHGYRPNGSERNGILYTCRGGHIDLAHLRNVADWTGYLASKSYWHIDKKNKKFSFELGEEAMCCVEIRYPDDWKKMSAENKAIVTKEVALGLGQYVAYQFSTWHEIVTWFGYKSAGIYPEFNSAFSWEDTYSNLLGSRVAYAALKNDELRFSDAVTLALDQEMARLGAQPRDVARQAARQMKSDKCKELIPTANIRTRNFDVGVGDGHITPWIIPSVGACQDEKPQSYPVPDMKFLDEYGFGAKFRIEPKVWEKNKILKIVFGDDYKRTRHIEPSLHFEKIMAHIEQEAAEKFGVLTAKESAN